MEMLIPKKLKVGFQKRTDTYTGMLGFITWISDKGETKQPYAWEGWRDKSINPVEYGNDPVEGFVLNKHGGGSSGRGYYHGDYGRKAFIRVWDPRGFEFEIGMANLSLILQECDSSKGKGLEGQFVYAWHGKDLVLLPVGCEDYNISMGFTKKQAQHVGIRQLVPGITYSQKTSGNSDLTYIGRFPYYMSVSVSDGKIDRGYTDKKHTRFIFKDGDKLLSKTSLGTLAGPITTETISDLSDWVEKYKMCRNATPVKELLLVPVKDDHEDWFQKSGETYHKWSNSYNSTYNYTTGKYESSGEITSQHSNYSFWLTNGTLYYGYNNLEQRYCETTRTERHRYSWNTRMLPLLESSGQKLRVVLENGYTFEPQGYKTGDNI